MPVHDFIAIGLGPFNLGLACLAAPLPDVRGLFLERRPRFEWHPGLLMDRCRLQTPVLADLVSLADPTSPFSYLNYVKRQGRIYRCYVRGDHYLTLTRHEYRRYCRWAASQLEGLLFGHEVTALAHDPAQSVYRVRGRHLADGSGFEHLARRLVIGIGTRPRLPDCCDAAQPGVHSADYVRHRAALRAGHDITLVGSGQSAAEIFRDLLAAIGQHGCRLTWVTRAQRFFQLENAKLALELSSLPDYADHFHGLPELAKASLLRDQKSLHAGIDARLIDEIHETLTEHEDEFAGRVRLVPGMALQACRRTPAGHEPPAAGARRPAGQCSSRSAGV